MNPEEYRRMYQIEDTFWWYQGMQRITFALLGKVVGARGRLKILDAGCGTGGMLYPLASLGEVTGIDFSQQATLLCSERKCGTILQGSVTDLPFADSSFDLITCFDVIYHLAVSDDEAVLREFRRVLRPGGRLLIRVPAYDFLRGKHDAAVATRHRYSLPELVNKLQNAGFKPARATYANTVLFPLAGAKRLWETISGSQVSAESDLVPVPRIVNSVLLGILTLESWLVKRVTLPFGLSAVCLAQKEE